MLLLSVFYKIFNPFGINTLVLRQKKSSQVYRRMNILFFSVCFVILEKVGGEWDVRGWGLCKHFSENLYAFNVEVYVEMYPVESKYDVKQDISGLAVKTDIRQF